MIIKTIILSTLFLNEPTITDHQPIYIAEARKRGKQHRGRRRGGSGLR